MEHTGAPELSNDFLKGNDMWRSRFTRLAVICGVLLWLPALSRAADSNGPEVALSVYKVVAQANGSETLAQGRQVKPGDRVEYAATYRNPGKLSIRNVQATLPIPAGTMQYIPSSASPTEVYASVNGKDFAPVPLMRVVTQADGTQRKQPVPLAEYRSLRWNLGDLEAGKSRTVKARMRVESQATEVAGPQTQGDPK